VTAISYETDSVILEDDDDYVRPIAVLTPEPVSIALDGV